ncbi:MAG: RNA-directed DNA polymerase [Kofleriaceae bacterium]|nr:RNA-directed DNA polymerase [Kofleriaceae bacterium]
MTASDTNQNPQTAKPQSAKPQSESPQAHSTSERVEWTVIAEAGGIHTWVYSELERQGLIDNVDTSTLTAAERKRYRKKRDEERVVRKILQKKAWKSYREAHIVHVGRGVFYHDTPDVDVYDVEDPKGRLESNDLPPIADALGLAKRLGIGIPKLRWLVFNREVDTGCHYHYWTVPKRDGGRRLISAPKPELKKAQAWIARTISEHLPIHGAAHGFVPGRSTVTNAAVHAGASVVFKFDIKDFFPSVTTNRVKGLLRKAGYGEQVATLMALLCTEFPREELMLRGRKHYVAIGARGLPQGAPTSPSLTNALCMRLDCRLTGLANSIGLKYSRYADDLTFSWHGEGKEAPVMRLRHAVRKIVSAEGFVIKDSKTRILRSGRRQRVTGLVVNKAESAEDARVPRFMLRQIRTAIYKLERGQEAKESLEQLRGWAAYVYMTDKKRGADMLSRLAAISSATTATTTSSASNSSTTTGAKI